MKQVFIVSPALALGILSAAEQRLFFYRLIQVAALSLITLTSACDAFSPTQDTIDSTLESWPAAPSTPTVVALGRLTPQGEVIKLSAPNAADSRVNQLLVQAGDWVEAGQEIALLQGFERRQRDLEEAQKQVEFYRAKLAQVQAGDAKAAEISAQKANITRLELQLTTEVLEREAAIAQADAELRQAQQDYQRKMMLVEVGAISQEDWNLSQESLAIAESRLQQRQAQLENTRQTLQQQIIQESEKLTQLSEVRPVDVRVAQAELERALIAVEQRRADLEDTRVRVPVAGQILRINTRVGEQVNTREGIVELGQTDQMYAIAEVYETDITQVAVGQEATIASEYGGFEQQIRGTVEQIGLQVGQPQLSESASDPTTDENTRVVEVKVRIDQQDSPKVASLTHMQVRIEIDTREGRAQEKHRINQS